MALIYGLIRYLEDNAMPRKKLRKPKWSYKQIKRALRDADGFPRIACDLLGMASTATLKKYIQADVRLQVFLEELVEDNLDIAEHSVMCNVKDGVFPASKFVLETLGAKRGYGKQVQVLNTQEYVLKLPDDFPTNAPKLVGEDDIAETVSNG